MLWDVRTRHFKLQSASDSVVASSCSCNAMLRYVEIEPATGDTTRLTPPKQYPTSYTETWKNGRLVRWLLHGVIHDKVHGYMEEDWGWKYQSKKTTIPKKKDAKAMKAMKKKTTIPKKKDAKAMKAKKDMKATKATKATPATATKTTTATKVMKKTAMKAMKKTAMKAMKKTA